MKTVILEIDSQRGVDELTEHPGIREGGAILREGGLVAFPTETVYGLGANGLDKEAVQKIYLAKGRPSDNPLIFHIVDVQVLEELVSRVPEAARALMERFWPGPLTIIFPKKACVPDEATGGLATVAVRMPSHPLAQALIAAAGVPVAAPSANRSGRPSPTVAEHVIQDMDGRVEMIIDGGSCEVGVESTVIDLTGGVPLLLRPGGISYEELQEVLGRVQIDVGVADSRPDQDFVPRSPGMKYRHYSPEAELVIVEGESGAVRAKIAELIADSERKVGLLATKEMVEVLRDDLRYDPHSIPVKILGSRGDLEAAAAQLFKLLREFDDEKVDLIVAEGLPLEGIGLAVMNRLRKAAGYQIIRV